MKGECLVQHKPAFTSRSLAVDSSALRRIVYGPDAHPNGFEALRTEWDEVVRRSRFNSLFLTHAWQTTWWEHLGNGELWIVAFRCRQSDELVGIAPLFLREIQEGEEAGKRQFNIVGCIEVSDYLDLIVARGWEKAVYAAWMEWLCSSDAPAWDIVDLCNLPEASLTYQELPEVARAAGVDVTVMQEDTAPQFPLPMRYEEYLSNQVDKKQRHEIRRKQRRAEREARVGFHLVQDPRTLAAEVEDFVALQRASRPDKAEFMTPQMQRFFLAVAQRLFEADMLRLLFLTLDGEKAAALFAFEYDRRFWLYNSGYDPASHAHLSPGWVLLGYAIQYAIASGCRVFDFMQGDEEYKYRFGAQDYKVMRVQLRSA